MATGIKKGNNPAYGNISGDTNTLEKSISDTKKTSPVMNFI